MSLLFNQTCLNKKKTAAQPHTHTHIYIYIYIYTAVCMKWFTKLFCLDVVQGRMNGAINVTRTHSCRSFLAKLANHCTTSGALVVCMYVCLCWRGYVYVLHSEKLQSDIEDSLSQYIYIYIYIGTERGRARELDGESKNTHMYKHKNRERKVCVRMYIRRHTDMSICTNIYIYIYMCEYWRTSARYIYIERES